MFCLYAHLLQRIEKLVTDSIYDLFKVLSPVQSYSHPFCAIDLALLLFPLECLDTEPFCELASLLSSAFFSLIFK